MLQYKRNRRIVISVGAGVFQRLAQVVGTLLVMPTLLRVLGPAQFGFWGAASSLAWLSGIVDVGTGAALVTLVARSSALNQVGECRSHISGALTIGTGVACLVVVPALLALDIGVSGGRGEPYLIAVIGLAINVPLSSANNVWMGLQKGYVSGFWEFIQTLLTTVALLAAAAFTADTRIFVAIVYAALVLANGASLTHLFLRHPELRPAGLVSFAAMRRVSGSGVMYLIVGVTGGLSFMLDNVLALELLGPDASARMTVVSRICMTAVGMLVVVSQPLWPAFADAAEKGDVRWIRQGLLRGSALLVAIAGAGSCILVVYGVQLLRLWLRADIGITVSVLGAIAAWIVAQALSRTPVLLLNGLLIVRYQIVVYSFATLVALGLKILLARDFGVGGILWGTTAAVLLVVIPLNIWRIHRWAKDVPRRMAEVIAPEEAAL